MRPKRRNWGIRVSGKVLVKDLTKQQAIEMRNRLTASLLYVEAVHLKVVG